MSSASNININPIFGPQSNVAVSNCSPWRNSLTSQGSQGSQGRHGVIGNLTLGLFGSSPGAQGQYTTQPLVIKHWNIVHQNRKFNWKKLRYINEQWIVETWWTSAAYNTYLKNEPMRIFENEQDAINLVFLEKLEQ